ncbi:penicillin-binding transpeptidase domain-containing protein [Nocardioides acrostichi]|uniref:Beta-lactamase n=1 Tax=Nocardioides acrostichi TaxID=2784339 RepID=A0A930Y6K2_9ACTN|nr:penicillin-binding transpeptidase domain-containing protein [Nocardioides acrostichi]MBF4161077.1 penicillin-binding protein [Nocardioides acrostichi]
MLGKPCRVLAAVAVAAAVPLTACSAVDAGPDPEPSADAVAAALSAGDLSDAPFADPSAAQKEFEAIVERLGDVEPTVEVSSVDSGDGDQPATATLSWSWPFTAGTWTYDSTVELSEAGDSFEASWAPSVVEPELTDGEVLDATTLEPTRGDIKGAGGQTIVTDRPVVRYGIDRSKVSKAKAVAGAKRLARLTDVDAASYAKRVAAAGDQAFVEAITYRVGDVPAKVAQGYRAVPGVLVVQGQLPLAPTRDFAAPILGSVGPVTAEMVEKNPDIYQSGDVAGLSGLQARYDEQLRGTPGVQVVAVPADDAGGQAEERTLFRQKSVDGDDLKLSLDVGLEQAAERALANVGPESALVAIKPSTGAILAAANGPGNDGYNIATYGQAAPGSTFKIATSLALLRAGDTPQTVLPCTPTITIDGKQFKNYSDYPAGGIGKIPLRLAVAYSCNTAFISQSGKLGGTKLGDAAASLGVGVDHEVGFPAYFGAVPKPESQTVQAADTIGQGQVLASPMAMATAIGSVQQGSTVVPWLVQGQQEDAPDGVAPLTAREASSLKAMLRAVVTDGSGRGLLDVPGPAIIAKTGTAEFEKDGKTLTHAWMVAAQGDLAVAVYVAQGESGSGTAGPVLEQFLRAAQ